MLRQRSILSLIGSVGLCLAGCATSPFADPGSKVHPDTTDRHRSLALSAPALAETTGSLRWYDLRNDARLTTSAGYESPAYETSVTWTYDRQITAAGRVYDYTSSTTWRVRTQQTMR